MGRVEVSTYMGEKMVKIIERQDPPPHPLISFIEVLLSPIILILALLYISLLDNEDCVNILAAYNALGKKSEDKGIFERIMYKVIEIKSHSGEPTHDKPE